MTFTELLRHPPVLIAAVGWLLAVALLTGTLIWYFKVGKKREAEFNEKQRKHATFRRALTVPIIVGSYLLPWLIKDWPEIQLRNGEMLPVKLLVCLGIYLLLYAAMVVAGRLIFGEEGRLKPKKNITQQEENHDTHPQA